MAPLRSNHSPARVQVTPLVGAHLGVYLVLHERVSKADRPRRRTENNGHPAPTGLCACLGGEPRFADTGLVKNQDGMSFAGSGYPGDVLAKHIEL
jgi:hypothetical protein